MRLLLAFIACGVILFSVTGFAAGNSAEGPYKILRTAKVGGEGGFDYVYADTNGRRLYIARTGPTPRVNVFDLDSLAPMSEIPNTSARGAACDSKFHHGFASSKPAAMW